MPLASVIYSVSPHARAPTTGSPHAMACMAAMLCVSAVLGITNTSDAL
jgi:hypothetical protein